MPTNKDDLKKLTQLGNPSKPERKLEAFPNHADDWESLIVEMDCTEFRCYCPMTGQPDYAKINITYEPDKSVVESKSLKLYLESYSDDKVFHEHLALDIARDFMKFIAPRWVEVEAKFNIRGGIAISARASLRQ
jgi:7-cyano-7-deazaguanine reductase